ncbi:hypothetical protein DJ019_16435 [Phenylobacterium kunshanense]|uniref:Uncharacterized protein n=1 Tax=Phenylobacterium kunshanense TaxID=1445034 RepID=A0A328B8P0_9CAUL|nr:hypothetical protein DJ019_16435 [Phenylobacterium kunshanense]
MSRAPSSGISLDDEDAALVKGMLRRGDRQHDIAAWFGVNGGRIGEIAAGYKFRHVDPAAPDLLPPPGPYLSGREAAAFVQALEAARHALDAAERMVSRSSR